MDRLSYKYGTDRRTDGRIAAIAQGSHRLEERSIVMSVSVCLSVSVRDHISGTTRPIFTKFLHMLPMAVARSFSDGVVIRYVFPVLWMTSYLHIS